MQVGTTIDRDLYNKPLAAVHPGTLAAGALPQYNAIRTTLFVLTLEFDRNMVISKVPITSSRNWSRMSTPVSR